MYHFKSTEHAPETTILNEHTELSGRAIKFLKDFQIHAVRVLFEQYCKRDFCILNDESGLGKSASVAVFLGIVAVRKKCLIVVSNNEECITGWRFHLDILTDLKVSVLNMEKDYDATDYRVYIANWNTLRAMGDLSKLNFDLVVVDNREQILNNSFCISTLLKNFENKVQLVISSVDITSDVKLLHNVLRLGGRLDHQLENFKTFEQKYKLPDLKAISSKKSDLEDYFLKREILNDYCRSFRLRRYRHQFENVLPLVNPERYKAFLNEWRHATKEKTTNTALLIGEQLPYEIGTEELLEQYQTNPESLRVESVPALPSTRENADDVAFTLTQNTLAPPAALDITDDLMEMPPLVFVTDSDDQDEEEDVIFLSSESAEQAAAAIPVIEIEEEEDKTPEKPAAVNVKVEKLSPRKKSETVKEISTPETPMTTRPKNKRKTTTPSKKVEKSSPVANYPTPRTRSNKQSAIRTRKSVDKSGDKINEDKAKKATSVAKIRKEIKQPNKTPPQKEKTTEALQIKAEKITPKKHEATPNKAPSAESLALQAESSKKKKDIEKKSKTPNEHKSEVRAKKSKEDAPKTPTEPRRSQKRVSTPMIGVPLRETRNMQRNTRSSGGKRKCFALEFDDDNKKTKTQTKQKATASTEKIKNTRKAGKITNVETVPSKKADSAKDKQLTKTEKKSSTPKDLKTAKKSTADNDSKNTKKAKDATTKPDNSTQSSVIPMSSEYEEIQCGQKLYSSNDSSPQLLEKPNEFLKPLTPPPFRVSRLASSDSDVALLLPSSSSQKRKNAVDAVIVISSSQDEASLSSQASSAEQGRSARSSTTPTGTQKRKRFSKRISLPSSAAKEPLTFGDLLAKQRERAKSPDLFSVGSDAGVLTQGSSNILPFTQPNGKPPSGLSTTTSPIFGFKIFGSEVRSFQQSMAIEANPGNDQTTKRPMRGKRSCLNILDQMFEKNPDTNSVKNGKSGTENAKDKEQRKLRHASHNNVQTSASKSARKQPPNTADDSSQISQPTACKPIHDNQHKATGESDDIFEITNNATFGSTLRISASGHISPVATANNSNQHHSNNHNKITNYLIGNGSGNEQLLKTPNKRSQQQQEPGSGGSGVGVTSIVVATTQTRKSPKSAKSTQTTKLTKWFRRSSVDESCSNKTAQKSGNTDRDESAKSAKLVKRRRLDLSLKS